MAITSVSPASGEYVSSTATTTIRLNYTETANQVDALDDSYKFYNASGTLIGTQNGMPASINNGYTNFTFKIDSSAIFNGTIADVNTIAYKFTLYGTTTSTAEGTWIAKVSACGAPTAVELSAAKAYPSTDLTLTWSGASPGANNPITEFYVYRATSEEGPYELFAGIISSQTGGNTIVESHATVGETYYYKMRTIGTISGYDSGDSSVVSVLTIREGSTVGYYNGTQFVTATVQIFDGSTWKDCSVMMYDGSQWVDCAF